jgi:transcriptional regulator with XRE-family HTH domain
MTIGTRIRKIRTRHGMTLRHVAEACGVTVSLLSKVENGHAAPSVATLTRIAAALGVEVSFLLSEPSDEMTVVSRAERDDASSWAMTEKGYRFLALCARRMDKHMQPMLFVARKGEVNAGLLRHDGEEFVYVLEGKMNYRVGRVTHELAAGDSLYFDAEEPHDLEPLTGVVKYLAVFFTAGTPKPPAKSRGSRVAKPAAAKH